MADEQRAVRRSTGKGTTFEERAKDREFLLFFFRFVARFLPSLFSSPAAPLSPFQLTRGGAQCSLLHARLRWTRGRRIACLPGRGFLKKQREKRMLSLRRATESTSGEQSKRERAKKKSEATIDAAALLLRLPRRLLLPLFLTLDHPNATQAPPLITSAKARARI